MRRLLSLGIAELFKKEKKTSNVWKKGVHVCPHLSRVIWQKSKLFSKGTYFDMQ
jgi:hypothetical protein